MPDSPARALFFLPLLAVSSVLASPMLGCAVDEVDPLGPEEGPRLEPRTASWEDFPIILESVTPIDIANYTTVVDGTVVGLEDLVDVVSYPRGFQPCDVGALPDVDLDSFGYGVAEDTIDAAAAKGLHVMLPLPHLGSLIETCQGHIVGAQLWNHDFTVQIPLDKNEITSAYNAYWDAKAGNYIDEVVAYDVGNVVWAWRALDELRPTVGPELELARLMRQAIDQHDGTRPLMSYTANAYMPGSDVIASLLDYPNPSLSPHSPALVSVDPADPVARIATAGVVGDYYPHPVQLNLDAGGQLRPMFEHIMTGAYTEYVLGADGHTNRIHPYHRARLGVEARDNLEAIYSVFGETPPSTTVFHAPDLTAAAAAMTVEEAQHDFWAGLHVADGIYLYSFAYAGVATNAWDAYARGLHLIKSRMRDVLANGTRWTPTVSLDLGAIETVPGDHYVGLPGYGNSSFLASPVAPDDEHATVNATMVSLGSRTYLIMTNSWNQSVSFDVHLPACTTGATVVYGQPIAMSVVGTTLSDSFVGIDGRVYEIRVGSC